MISGAAINEEKLTSQLAGQAKWGKQWKSSSCFSAACRDRSVQV